MWTDVGTVAELWRYPVKSMAGEAVRSARCDRRGVEGDRRFALHTPEGKLGSGKTNRRFQRVPGLLSLAGRIDDGGTTWVCFEDGTELRAGEPATSKAIRDLTGADAELTAEGDGDDHFDDAPIHLLTAASLSWLHSERPGDAIDVRRFRPNLLVDTGGGDRPEEGWLDAEIRVGEVLLSVVKATKRCVMVTLPQDGLGFAPRILKHLEATSATCLGCYAEILSPGVLRVGDPVAIRPGPNHRR